MTPSELAADLRSRINPLYAAQLGTESYERRVCAETLEKLIEENAALLAANQDSMDHYNELREELASIKTGQEPVARFNWNKGGFEWLAEYSYNKHNMKPLFLAAGAQPSETEAKDVCKLCGSDSPFTGSCGGGRSNPKALCYEVAPVQAVAQHTVTCQIYGHVVDACVECNVHTEADAQHTTAGYTFEDARRGGVFKPAHDVCPTWYATALRKEGWDAATAAGAQPVPVGYQLVPTCMVLRDADLKFLSGLSQLDDEGNYSDVRLTVGAGHAGHGLYASLDEYPEEGADIICEFPAAPVQAQERPISSGHPDDAGFELWWSEHMPEAVQSVAISAWNAAQPTIRDFRTVQDHIKTVDIVGWRWVATCGSGSYQLTDYEPMRGYSYKSPVYEVPPVQAQERKPLTDEQIYAIWPYPEGTNSVQTFARAIEAAHGIK